MNPDQNQEQPDPKNNEYVPPPPGAYAPHEQFEEAQPKSGPQSNQLSIDQQIHKKKRQARMFLGAMVVFGILFIGGIILILTSVGSEGSTEPDPAREGLSTEEKLKADVNALGLAIINYNNGNQPFEISPQTTSELRVSYLQKEFSDPRTNEPYTLVTSIPEVGELQYILGGVCNTDDSVSQSGDETSFAIRVLLEAENQLYCLESSEVQQLQTPPTP